MNMTEAPSTNKIQLDWNNDNRNEKEKKYDNSKIKESRMRAFLAGWQDFLEHKTSLDGTPQPVTWDLLGMWCGEKYGPIHMELRRGLYILFLQDYLNSPRCSHWTKEKKENAILIGVAEALRLHFEHDGERNQERIYGISG